MRVCALPLAFVVSGFAAGCDGGGKPPPMPTTVATAAPATASATTSQANAAPSAPARPASGFVRRPPHSNNSDADAVDECTQVGGNYFSCRGAYLNEKDPVMKRYLWRIAQAHAAGQSDYTHRGERSTDMPHAEVPYTCDPSKRCGARDDRGELNGTVSCLARAHSEYLAHDAAASRAAHALACKCNPTEGTFPGYNATAFICDKQGKPAFIAPDMKKDEAADIVDCAVCEPTRGPSACDREIERLKASDSALAKHIETRQVQRCKTPSDGPGSWDQWSSAPW